MRLSVSEGILKVVQPSFESELVAYKKADGS